MRKFLDGKEIIESGSIVIIPGQKVRFELGCGFVVNFDFCNDGNFKENHFQARVVENELSLSFFNFLNSLGTANRDLIELGSIGAEKVFLSFAIYCIGDKEHASRIVHYTFLKAPTCSQNGRSV